MTATNDNIWMPNQAQIDNSNITRLCERLGLADYQALYDFSVADPEAYWREILDVCSVKWSVPPTSFMDDSKGPEFPIWFAGGKLNWTNTIFAWAKNPEAADKTAVIAEDEQGNIQRISYSELHRRVRRFAGGLAELGLKPGDRVGLLMEPGIEAVVSMIGLSYAGCVVMPLFSGFGAAPIIARLEACAARALICTAGFSRRGKRIDVASIAREVRSRIGLEHLMLKQIDGGEPLSEGETDWNVVAEGPMAGPEAEAMEANDTFMIFYTSGTTGTPKGIVHSHAGFPLKIAHDALVHFDMQRDDVFFWPADMGWIAGALIITASLMHGATMVCYDGAPNVPDLSRMSKMIERHGVTHFGSAPTMIRSFAANEEEAMQGDVSSVRLLITGGEAIDPEHFIWYHKNFGHGVAPVINYSGGTEASGALVSSVITRPIIAGGFNTPAPGISVDVVDAAGNPVVDQVGELVIRGPFVGMTHSFWRDDERYLNAYWRTLPGLWVHGDLAIRDCNGNYALRGRSDDTLKLAGKRIGPGEIEDVLMELPEVVEVAAIGVADGAKGQSLVIFAITRKGTPDLADVISNHAEERLGRAFRPQKVHLVSDLPRTRSAKVMRRMIRAVYCDIPPGDTSSMENPGSLDELRSLRAMSTI